MLEAVRRRNSLQVNPAAIMPEYRKIGRIVGRRVMSASELSLLDIVDRFPTEEAATRRIENAVWCEQRCYGNWGKRAYARGPKRLPDALPVRGLPSVLQRPHGHRLVHATSHPGGEAPRRRHQSPHGVSGSCPATPSSRRTRRERPRPPNPLLLCHAEGGRQAEEASPT